MGTITPADRIAKLERLLVGLLDGIDGYVSENGSLDPYWNKASVAAARKYLKDLPDKGYSAGYWLADQPAGCAPREENSEYAKFLKSRQRGSSNT